MTGQYPPSPLPAQQSFVDLLDGKFMHPELPEGGLLGFNRYVRLAEIVFEELGKLSLERLPLLGDLGNEIVIQAHVKRGLLLLGFLEPLIQLFHLVVEVVHGRRDRQLWLDLLLFEVAPKPPDQIERLQPVPVLEARIILGLLPQGVQGLGLLPLEFGDMDLGVAPG